MKYTIGIQGGKGSFNEQAAELYIKSRKQDSFEIVYLYTSLGVLKAVSEGIVEYGLFAVCNSIGGLVEESMRAMGEYDFCYLDSISLQISHNLMIRHDVDPSSITTIMAHPQVLKQCSHTLATKYPHLHTKSGEGELIDTARAAEALAKGELDPSTAILGPAGLARIYAFTTIDFNLQDDMTNHTTFIIVKRKD